MKPLTYEEKEYRQGLERLERRAIIPIKWGIFAVSLLLWFMLIGTPPSMAVFLLFFAYFMANLALSIMFYGVGVSNALIKPLTLASYLADVIFVSMLIYFDLATHYLGPTSHHSFYFIYFLLVLRGFALFKTIGETIFVNLLISILFVLTFYVQSFELGFLIDTEFIVSLILIWFVVLMSWFIIMVINRQKMELIEVHDHLMRADSLARVGELAAGVAHEINNPLGIITATADYLSKVTPEDDERSEEIKNIHREAMRCKEILTQMLTFARPRPTEHTVIDLRQINDEVLAFVMPTRGKVRCDIIKDYDAATPPIQADPNLVKQALLNLYINARQALVPDRTGRITSRIRPVQHKTWVRLEIEDNGTGIDEAHLEHIFDPFYTSKPEGTGLGLAVTQRIVERLGGNISVEPSKPEGTRFTLEFPASRESDASS